MLDRVEALIGCGRLCRPLAVAVALHLVAALPAFAADPAIVEAARKEGQVVWYTTLIVNQIVRPLQDAFEKKYPGVKLQYSRADDAPTALKILSEARAEGKRVVKGSMHFLFARDLGLSRTLRPPSPASQENIPVHIWVRDSPSSKEMPTSAR